MTTTDPEDGHLTADAPSSVRPLAQMMRIADETITVGDLIHGQQLYTVRPGWPAARALAELTDRGYTQAAVTDVPIRRYVTLDDLRTAATVDEASRAVPASMFIAATSPLSAALERLDDHPMLFVTHQGHTIGIVTLADLEQPAVSLLVLGMITATETALNELIERASSRRWIELLDDNQRDEVERIYQDRCRYDAEFSHVACLDLTKRFDLALKLELTGPLGFPSKTAFRRWKETIQRIRNLLAHGSTILSAVPDPADAVTTIAEIRRFATRSWQLVTDEHAKLAAFAEAVITLDADPDVQLAGPDATATLPVASPAFVITADNPHGLLADPTTNQRRREQLRTALEQLDVRATPVTGGAGQWLEASWLLPADQIELATVLRLATDLDQDSIFRLDHDTIQVIRAQDGHVLTTEPRKR